MASDLQDVAFRDKDFCERSFLNLIVRAGGGSGSGRDEVCECQVLEAVPRDLGTLDSLAPEH